MTYSLELPIPPLRQDLELTEAVHEGEPIVILTDMLGLSDESFVISPAVLMVAALFDGTRDAAAVHAELVKNQIPLKEEDVRTVARELKEAGLLETDEAQERRRRLFEEFRAGSVRKFHSKLRGLPESALDLGVLLSRFYKHEDGPGAPYEGEPLGPPPLGIVAPHIDFFRGGPHYAWAYNELAKRQPPDVIVSLGVAHISPRSPWVMTRKAYQTPYGPMEVDESLYEEIGKALWYDPLEEEWVHAKEHSLEFQALWLKHIWMKNTPKWVPILCSAFENFTEAGAPSSVPSIEEAINKIGGILAERKKRGQKVLVLAGVDLAHIGRKFGDDLDITDEVKTKVEALDRKSLEDALKLEADPFFLAGAGQNAWRKICGLSATYTALRWIRALHANGSAKSRLLSYGQAPDPAGGIVSFTSAIFEESDAATNESPNASPLN